METGKIKTLPEGKPFGFIAREGKDDLFFHESALVGVTLGDLKVGDEVTFEEVPGKNDPNRMAAANVSLVK